MAPNPVEILQSVLKNATDLSALSKLVAPDATYISLTHANPDLRRILPYAGAHTHAGPRAIYETFQTVNTIWENEDMETQAIFSSGEDVALFGSFTYRSRTLGKACTSPFAVWAKVNAEGLVTYMQFMEDTLGSTDTFLVGGKKTYKVFEEQGEFSVPP